MSGFSALQKRSFPFWLPYAAAALGLALYFIQSVIFAHTTVSNLDEGAYLLKGALFASGEYRPFDPGISTNKAPFAFLIPGYVQLLFGAGLRTGRYLAVFFGVMAVVGTWAAARRIGGNWLAAGAVWVFTLSPTVIKYYSGGATQSVIACLMAWSLFLILGENRRAWQLVLSGFLVGVMVMTRQNMLPVLPAMALYAFWQHRWKGVGFLLSSLSFLAIVHAAYWPQILQLWNWIPGVWKLAPAPLRTEVLPSAAGGIPIWQPQIEMDSRLLSFFQAVRFHFAPLAGGFISILLFPQREGWKSREDFRAGVFLLVLFWGLVFMHALAAIGEDYCVYCLSPYLAFFNVAGILFLVVLIRSWNWKPAWFTQALLVLSLLAIYSGSALSAFENIGDFLLALPAPRVRDLRLLPGFIAWGEILSNKFGWTRNASMRYMSSLFGLALGLLILAVGYFIWKRRRLQMGFGAFFAALTLALGFLFSPLLHASTEVDCRSDVIAANERIGEHLRSLIPPGSLVYWDGGLSMAPMLYLPQAKIFPPQINDGYSFISDGDTATLYKFGWWNEEMAAEWKATADFFIIEQRRYSHWNEFFTPQRFDEFPRSPLGTSCLNGSTLRIFHRK